MDTTITLCPHQIILGNHHGHSRHHITCGNCSEIICDCNDKVIEYEMMDMTNSWTAYVVTYRLLTVQVFDQNIGVTVTQLQYIDYYDIFILY